MTFHELTPNGVDLLRDEDGFISDAPSEAVEKVFNDPLCTMPSILALTEVELKVDAAIIELEMERDTGEDLYSNFQFDGGFYLPEKGFETMGFVYRKGDENAFIHDLWDNPEMCSKPHFAEKVDGYPAEEYIMEHDGVKTEFQITEVKRYSFAYDQGARFDVKVLTDGHDCGNGRFCADLDEAHEYCQQFADSIAGIGESLDDMCEDRSEIASAIQDAKVAERGQVDKRHDDSEIGE